MIVILSLKRNQGYYRTCLSHGVLLQYGCFSFCLYYIYVTQGQFLSDGFEHLYKYSLKIRLSKSIS